MSVGYPVNMIPVRRAAVSCSLRGCFARVFGDVAVSLAFQGSDLGGDEAAEDLDRIVEARIRKL